MFMYT